MYAHTGTLWVALHCCSGNAAYGVCQNTARDKNYSPCAYMFNGAGKCTKESFWEFYGSKWLLSVTPSCRPFVVWLLGFDVSAFCTSLNLSLADQRFSPS
jgi:hypothetical protein